MEDGIESIKTTIYETLDSFTSKNVKKQLYVCIPSNNAWENMLITYDYNKALEISRKKNYKIEIYTCELDGIYNKS